MTLAVKVALNLNTINYNQLKRQAPNRNNIPSYVHSNDGDKTSSDMIQHTWPSILMVGETTYLTWMMNNEWLGSVKNYFIKNWLILYSHRYSFWRINHRQLLKTLWEKEKLLVRSNFSFSHNVFLLNQLIVSPFVYIFDIRDRAYKAWIHA